MPANRRYRTRGRRADLAELDHWQRTAMGSGPLPCLVDADELVELWSIHGESFLEDWIAENPGTRPWGWWAYQADSPRRVLNAPRHPGHYLNDTDRKQRGQVWVGSDGGTVAGPTGRGGFLPWLEPEAAYLARHGLLTDSERESLAAAAGAV